MGHSATNVLKACSLIYVLVVYTFLHLLVELDIEFSLTIENNYKDIDNGATAWDHPERQTHIPVINENLYYGNKSFPLD